MSNASLPTIHFYSSPWRRFYPDAKMWREIRSLGAPAGLGLRSNSRCLWDSNTDKNLRLYAVAGPNVRHPIHRGNLSPSNWNRAPVRYPKPVPHLYFGIPLLVLMPNIVGEIAIWISGSVEELFVLALTPEVIRRSRGLHVV